MPSVNAICYFIIIGGVAVRKVLLHLGVKHLSVEPDLGNDLKVEVRGQA